MWASLSSSIYGSLTGDFSFTAFICTVSYDLNTLDLPRRKLSGIWAWLLGSYFSGNIMRIFPLFELRNLYASQRWDIQALCIWKEFLRKDCDIWHWGLNYSHYVNPKCPLRITASVNAFNWTGTAEIQKRVTHVPYWFMYGSWKATELIYLRVLKTRF